MLLLIGSCQEVKETKAATTMVRNKRVAKGGRDPDSRSNLNKIHASRFASVIVGETSGKRNFPDQIQIIHESPIPYEINHASHAFRYSRITFLFLVTFTRHVQVLALITCHA